MTIRVFRGVCHGGSAAWGRLTAGAGVSNRNCRECTDQKEPLFFPSPGKLARMERTMTAASVGKRYAVATKNVHYYRKALNVGSRHWRRNTTTWWWWTSK